MLTRLKHQALNLPRLDGGLSPQVIRADLDKLAKSLSEYLTAELAKKAGKNDLAAFTEDLRKPNRFWQHALKFEVIEDTPKAYEVKVTECIWAKTLRGFNAGDLGYLLSCYGDYAAAEGFNPKMRMIRTKTLMQGDDCCNHRYVIEGLEKASRSGAKNEDLRDKEIKLVLEEELRRGRESPRTLPSGAGRLHVGDFSLPLLYRRDGRRDRLRRLHPRRAFPEDPGGPADPADLTDPPLSGPGTPPA